MTLPANFWRHVEKTETCWLWTGTLSPDGYARIKVGGRNRAAHRVSYEHFVGPIVDGLTLDHLCEVRRCVNPEHLEAVTIAENLHRSSRTAASRHASRTHCPAGHEYAGENLYVHRGKRYCRTCRRERRQAA